MNSQRMTFVSNSNDYHFSILYTYTCVYIYFKAHLVHFNYRSYVYSYMLFFQTEIFSNKVRYLQRILMDYRLKIKERKIHWRYGDI